MTETRKLVAILAANPALTSILAKSLAGEAGLRVCEFEAGSALVTFMRISPLDLVIVDIDSADPPAVSFAHSLRRNGRLASPQFDIIALTRAAPGFNRALLDAGFDEVLNKPVSTTELLDRVAFRLVQNQRHPHWGGIYRGPERRSTRRARQQMREVRDEDPSGNIVPLFSFSPASKD